MPRRYRLEILAVVAVVAFVVLFLYTSATMPSAEFAGSDNAGSAQISSLTGIPTEEFQPLIPQWEPPSGEIESGLFALQAAAGGIVLGFFLGYWKGQNKGMS